MRKTNTGFTLIELLITITIGAILLTLAVPSFQEVIQNNRLTTQANNLVTAINMARSEAIKRRTSITVCPSVDQESCDTNAPWEGGWIVRNDSNGEALRYFGEMRGTTSMAAAPDHVRYTPRGFLDGGNVTMVLCAQPGTPPAREINITASGRPATSRKDDC